MAENKAYKVLAVQERISNRAAKDFIDRGMVFLSGKKLTIARQEIPEGSKLYIEKHQTTDCEILLTDENLFAVNKLPYFTSDEISADFGYSLIHRLDKGTSGILLMAKSRRFKDQVVSYFHDNKVYKEYTAWITGILPENITVDKEIKTKKSKRVRSYINSGGKTAVTKIEPLEVKNKCTKVAISISTGRTHQIRVHLKSIGHPVLGDTEYGGKSFARLMLHATKLEMPGYSIAAPLPDSFDLLN